MEKKHKQGGWNQKKNGKEPMKIPFPKSEQGEVITYFLTDEQLAKERDKYRNLKPPIPEKMVCTTAPRDLRTIRSGPGQI